MLLLFKQFCFGYDHFLFFADWYSCSIISTNSVKKNLNTIYNVKSKIYIILFHFLNYYFYTKTIPLAFCTVCFFADDIMPLYKSISAAIVINHDKSLMY